MGDYIMRREQNNLHLICGEKERKNELIMQKLTRMRQDMNTNENKAKKGDKINKILLSWVQQDSIPRYKAACWTRIQVEAFQVMQKQIPVQRGKQ